MLLVLAENFQADMIATILARPRRLYLLFIISDDYEYTVCYHIDSIKRECQLPWYFANGLSGL